MLDAKEEEKEEKKAKKKSSSSTEYFDKSIGLEGSSSMPMAVAERVY
jgi:hypothetical protein